MPSCLSPGKVNLAGNIRSKTRQKCGSREGGLGGVLPRYQKPIFGLIDLTTVILGPNKKGRHLSATPQTEVNSAVIISQETQSTSSDRLRKLFDGGDLDLLDLGVQRALELKAVGDSDRPAGIVLTSAAELARWLPHGLSESRVRRALRQLESRGLIKSFGKARSRGSYPILVDNLIVTHPSGARLRVNAEKTRDWKEPFLEPVDVSSPKTSGIEVEKPEPARTAEPSQPKPAIPPGPDRFRALLETLTELRGKRGLVTPPWDWLDERKPLLEGVRSTTLTAEQLKAALRQYASFAEARDLTPSGFARHMGWEIEE